MLLQSTKISMELCVGKCIADMYCTNPTEDNELNENYMVRNHVQFRLPQNECFSSLLKTYNPGYINKFLMVMSESTEPGWWVCGYSYDGNYAGVCEIASRYKDAVVEIDGVKKEVVYKFIDEDTIECVDENGKHFYTHYKSLVVKI